MKKISDKRTLYNLLWLDIEFYNKIQKDTLYLFERFNLKIPRKYRKFI
jgi:hypothetical protein